MADPFAALGFQPQSAPASVQPTQSGQATDPFDALGFKALTPAVTQPAQKNLIQDAANYTGGSIKNAFQSGVQQVQQGIQQGSTTNNPVSLLESGAKVAAGAVSTVFSPLAPITAPIGNAINAVGDQIGNTPVVQQFAQSGAGKTISRIAEDVGNVATIAQGAAGFEGAPEASGAVSDAAGVVADKVSNLIPEKTQIFEGEINPIDPKVAAQIKGVADDWQKPTTINMAQYNKARVALEIQPETPQFLAEHGLNPFTHIEDGKYETEMTAQTLRDTAGKLSRDTLRPSLQMADYTTPTTAVTDLTKPSLENVNNQSNITAGDSKAINSNIKSELQALQEKYPDGMSLTNMHDEKITYAQNGGYKPYADAAENNRAIANRAISNALGDMVEKKAPADIPVKEFNTNLSKYYKAADYLDALNGKKAPVSIGQKIVRGAAGLVGAKIGSLIPGMGDIVGSYAGYKLGNVLEYTLENMTNPMRDTFLRNLKITNPEAFTRVSKFITEQEAQRASIPRIEAPKLNTSGTTMTKEGMKETNNFPKTPQKIITPAPTTYEAPAEIINRINSKPGKTIFDMLSKAQQKNLIEKFKNEPYIPNEKLPVIKAGKTPKSKPSNLPTIK